MIKRKRGRKPLSDPPLEKSLMLPSSLVAEVELLLYDPTTERVRYGSFSKLVERLLREWLSSRVELEKELEKSH